MSTNNIPAFFEKARQDQALAAKIDAIFAETEAATSAALVALGSEVGLTFTAEDLRREQESALADADLAGVAGGMGQFGEGMNSDYVNPPRPEPTGTRYTTTGVIPGPLPPPPKHRASWH